eukprot:TRINITY_DN55383_c0_g1_i1.p1 TRINITY_DN55383_c0_g1~~TRINITY_DN55383_c0_g1_i1.p1  ORF type:complete len:413 (+),score=60.82 TRINITY_DN55383_c0_g1_i1:79-1317(+)
MAPKKKVEEEVVEPEVVEEPPEPEIVSKCFRTEGQLYAGECKANGDGTYVRSGQGKQVFTTKDVSGNDVIVGTYSGGWVNDLMEGEGIFRWPDGSWYDGSFYMGLPHGFRGHYEWPDGSSYEGTWVNGQMMGQGRFDSRTEGSFLSGKFYRNWHVRTDGRWINVCDLQARAERKAIAEGDSSYISIHRRAPRDCEGLKELLMSVYDDGYVPFVIGDATMQESTLKCLNCAASSSSTVSVSEAATQRGIKGDFHMTFYRAIQTALLQNVALHVVFDDMSIEDDAPLPDDWRLQHFIDAEALPLEVFSPKLFNGRSGFLSFLTPELYDSFRARLGTAAMVAPGAPQVPPTEEVAQDASSPGIFHLRTVLAASAKLEADLSDDSVRAAVVERYGAHLPLHRTQIVLLTASDTPEA